MIKRILTGLFICLTILVLSSLFLGYKIARNTNTALSFNLTQSIKSCSDLDNAVISKKNQEPNFIVISEPSIAVIFDSMLKVLSNIQKKFQATSLNYEVISEIYINISEAKRAYLSLWDVPVTDTIRLQYKIKNPQDLQIQDISLMLPNFFHQNISYELSCRSTSENRELIVFRKLSAKIHTHNYEEPPVSLLPRACLFNIGEVVVRIYDKRDMKYYLNQLKSIEFRAVLWQPRSNTINQEPLNLYLSKMSYLPGQTIKIHAHAIDPSISASLEILSLGKNAKSLKKIDNITLETQAITPYSYRDGLNWSVTSSVKLASDAAYGYYAAVLRQGKTQATFPFIIRPKKGDSTPIAIIAATNTWQAYNDWGKGSFYSNEIGNNCLATNYARLISSQRPINYQDPFHEAQPDDHLIRAELLIAKWLEKSEHNYVVYSEDDLNEDPSILKKHKIVLLPSHPEYYTEAMLNAIEQHIQGGGNILSLGGNALYYKIAMKGHQLEKHANGRVFDLSADFGGFWSTHHARSSASILGVEYDARDYNTFQPYAVKAADHPIFKGTNLKNGDLIAPKGSGHEMDVRNSFTPPNTILLAKGTNPKGYGADMVLIELPSGAKVFSAGSLSFAYGMSNDKKVQMLLDNLVKLMTEG